PDRAPEGGATTAALGTKETFLDAPVVQDLLDLGVRGEPLPSTLAEDQVRGLMLAVLTNGVARVGQVTQRVAGRTVERPWRFDLDHVRGLRAVVEIVQRRSRLIGESDGTGLENLRGHLLDGPADLAFELPVNPERLFRGVDQKVGILKRVLPR